MRELSIREIRVQLTHIDDLLAETGEVVITRRGKPIARLLPLATSRTMPSHADLRASMPPLSVASEVLVREDRDQR